VGKNLLQKKVGHALHVGASSSCCRKIIAINQESWMMVAAQLLLNSLAMITIVYGSILRPSSNNWASYRRLKWQIAALFR
jgi:hypothetical protein